MLKKGLSFILALIVCISVIVVTPVASSAKVADLSAVSKNVDLAQTGGLGRIGIMKKFPQDAYWNHQIQEGHYFKGEYVHQGPCNDPDGYSLTPCYNHFIDTSDIPIGEYDCNEFGGALQCMGFAKKISTDIYGSCYTEWGTGSVWDCKPGDVVNYPTGRPYGHTLMIVARNGSTVTVGECNYDDHCKISWNRTMQISDFGAAVCYVAPRILPEYEFDTPVLKSVDSVANGLKVTWDPVEGAPKYAVYARAASAARWTLFARTDSNQSVFPLAKYKSTYYFTVRCLYASGEVASDYDHNGIAGVYRFMPKITAKSGSGKISLSWDKISKAKKYRVYVKGGKVKSFVKFVDTTKTAYDYRLGSEGVVYTFTVRGIGSDGQFNSDYDPVGASARFVRSLPSLSTPKGLKAAPITKQGAVKVSWNAVKKSPYYNVYVKHSADETKWKKIGTTKTNSFIHTGCANNTVYIYTVRCVNKYGMALSGYKKTGVALRYFRYPENVRAAKVDNNGSINIAYDKVPGAAFYAVYYKTSKNGKWKRIPWGKNRYPCETLSGCKNGVTYTFTVRACDRNDKLISSYDPVGYSVKYAVKSRGAWANIYKSFVQSHSYLKVKTPYGYASSLKISLYDIDRNGVPELIIDSGQKTGVMNNQYSYVFTIKNQKAAYCGCFECDAYNRSYNPHSKYKGLFVLLEGENYQNYKVRYVALSSGKVSFKDVALMKGANSLEVYHKALFTAYSNSSGSFGAWTNTGYFSVSKYSISSTGYVYDSLWTTFLRFSNY